MAKMHEHLAVEEEIVGRSNSIIEETINSFKHKTTELFTGGSKTYLPLVADDKNLVPPVNREIVDSVPSKLKYTANKVAEEYDYLLKKEATNQTAKADVVINGKVLLANAPVNFLLSLERRLEKFRNVLNDAPTLPNGFKWVPDEQKGAGFFKLETAEISYRTAEKIVPILMAPATQQHPAQVKEGKQVDVIGTYTEMKNEGRLTSRIKSELLERMDVLLREVKQAIRRANQADVVEKTVGTRLFDFLLTGDVKEA